MSDEPKRLPVVLIVPREEAARLLMSTSDEVDIGCVVSIGDPGQRQPPGLARVTQRLRLEFHDVLEDSDEDTAPCTAHVERIIRFAERTADTPRSVLVHCEAGISRSTAAALILYAVWLGPGAEEDAASRVFASVPHAFPNQTMVRLADGLLKRSGALIAAVIRLAKRGIAD